MGAVRRVRFSSLTVRSKWILILVCAVLSLREVSAQEVQEIVPAGAHHAGQGPGTGGGRGYTTSAPLDLPPARGGLPIPVRLDIGGTQVGALGRGGDVQLSFVRDLSSFAQRRPTGAPGVQPSPKRRVTLSLLGQEVDLVLKTRDSSGETWVPQRGSEALTIRKIGALWRAYASDGLTYTFTQPAMASPLGLWLLDRIEGPAGARVQLEYEIAMHQVLPTPEHPGASLPPAYFGASIDLTRVLYNLSSSGSPKHEIALVYGNEQSQPMSLSVANAGIRVRMRKLESILVLSRAVPDGALHRLAAYQFHYNADPDTRLPRVDRVTMTGQGGTPASTQVLPIVSYEYGAATTAVIKPDGTPGAELQYRKLPLPVALPAGAATDLLSASVKISNPSRFVVRQQLMDVTGDGRPDMVFSTSSGLFVARNRADVSGASVLNDPALSGTFNGGPMTKKFLDSFAPPTKVDPFPNDFLDEKTDSITDTWTQFIDVNGDGRPDLIDAAELPGNKWVVYLNTPAANSHDTIWIRKVFDIQNLRTMLEARGNKMPSSIHVPLMRQYTGAKISAELCFEYDYDAHVWKTDFGNDCDAYAGGANLLPRLHRQGWATQVAWRLLDFNGDGGLDLLMQSQAPHMLTANQRPCYRYGSVPQPGVPGCFVPPRTDNHQIGRRTFDLARDGELVVAFNQGLITSVFPTSAPYALGGCGPGRWGTKAIEATTSSGASYIRTEAFESCALQDINGDGLLDSVQSVDDLDSANSNRIAFLGTGGTFSTAYLVLPGPTGYAPIQPCLTYNGNPTTSGDYNTETRTGYVDVTGDGIPDFIGPLTPGPIGLPPGSNGNPIVRIGTGFGFAPPITISGDLDGTPDRRFLLSSTRNACDSTSSRTLEGSYDLDGDGRPEQVKLNNGSLDVFQIVGRTGDVPVPRALSAGLLTAISNGFGGRTEISYRSAKDDASTDHQLPYSEIVVSSVKTIQKSTGISSETLYAYGNAQLSFDSVVGSFRSYGYGRTISVTKVGPGRTPGGPEFEGNATFTDAYSLADPASPTDVKGAFGRHLIAGRPKEVSVLSGIVRDPWEMLTTDVAGDLRRISGTQFLYDTRFFVIPHLPDDLPAASCVDVVHPFGAGTFSAMDPCKTRGFAFQSGINAWRGKVGPPSDMNIMTDQKVLAVDDLGQTTLLLDRNDSRRSDDDLCIETTYATPLPPAVAPPAWDGMKRSAVAERKVMRANADRFCADPPLVREFYNYDELPTGQVSNGFLTSQQSERRDTQSGALLDASAIRRFDVQYDTYGNANVVTTDSGDGRTRTLTRGYDPFGLVPISFHTVATGAATLDTRINIDAVTLHPLTLTEPNQTQLGMTYDGFGRPVLSTVRPPGGVVGALAATTYLGFEGGDPLGRRVVETYFDNPVDLANVGTTVGHSATTSIDDFGRSTRTVLGLGTSYTDDLVENAVTYDAFGRVAYVADPFHTGQNESTAYGTTHFYNTDGTLKCLVRGYGKQSLPTTMFGSTDEANERYPTCYSHDFIAGQVVEGVWSPDALLMTSPQAGVQRLTRATAIGRIVSRETWSPATRLEHAEYAYDRLGNRISMTRYRLPGNAVTLPSDPVQSTFEFDSFGQLLRQVEPNTVPREKAYSNWGELLKTYIAASPIGPTPERQEKMSYDGLGRLTHAEQVSDGAVVPQTVFDYHYDFETSPTAMMTATSTLGRLAWMSGPSGNVYFSYDPSGRTHVMAYQDPSKALYIQIADYEGDGTLSKLGLVLPDNGQNPDTNPAPEFVKYGYDTAGRLRSATFVDPNGVTRELFKANVVDAFGRVREARVGNAVYHASYADIGRRLLREIQLQSPSGTMRGLSVNGYDPMVRERGRSEKTGTPASSILTHSYDSLGRLAKSVRVGGSAPSNRTFHYDALGNLLKQIDALGNNSVDMSYVTAAGGNRDQLCSIGYGSPAAATCDVFHDAEGNIVEQPTRAGVRRLTYLPSGRVSSISMPNGTQADFRYDAVGAVQELDVRGPTNDTRKDRRYGMVERRDVTGSVGTSSILTRTFDLGYVTASRRGMTDLWVYTIGESRGNRYFLDQTGELIQEIDYEAYGEERPQGAMPGSTLYSREQWNGGDHLAGLGLSQLGVRIYDPVVGRFLSTDPRLLMGSASASNPYAFAFNDPINFSDPSGMCPPEGCAPGIDNGGGTDIGDATRPKGRVVGSRHSPAPLKLTINLPAVNDPTLPENQYLVEGINTVAIEREERQRAYHERMYQAQAARMCKRWPETCPEQPGIFKQTVQSIAGVFSSAVSPPSYYLRASDTRVLHFGLTGPQYFRARDLQNAAAANVAAGRFYEKTTKYFQAAMDLSGAMISLGAAGSSRGSGKYSYTRSAGCPKCPCFVPGTSILMADGRTKHIENIEVGDWVLAADPEGEERAHAYQVSGTLKNTTERVVRIEVGSIGNSGFVEATGEHPFWTLDNGWVAAASLQVGDRLLDPNGGAVDVLEVVLESRETPTYNLEVRGAQTFFVMAGNRAVLVHNQSNSLGEGYTYRVDSFTTSGRASFEVHVFNPAGIEIGVHGETEWIPKHGFTGGPVLSENVENRLRSLLIVENRARGLLPEKGAANIKGNNWKTIVEGCP